MPAAQEAEAPVPRRGARILRDFLFQSGSRYLGAVLGILRGLVIPRFLDPALYGVFKTYGTFSELSRIATLGIPSALFRELPIANSRGQSDRALRLLDNGFWSTVLSAIPFAIAFLVGGLTGWIRFAEIHLSVWYLLFIPLLFVDRTKIFFDVVFTCQKQFVFQAKLRLFDEVATTCLGLFGAWAYGFNGFLGAMFLANGLITGMAWWGSRFKLRHAFDLPLGREMVSVGFPQLMVGLSNTVYNQLDRMAIIVGGLGMTAVGWYSVGMTINEQIAFGSQIVARVLMPRMMEAYGKRERVEDIRSYVIAPLRIAGLAYAGIIVLCAMAGDIVYGVWLTKYAPGLLPMKIMLVGMYFMAVWASVHPFFLAIKQQRYLLYVFLGTIPLAAVLLTAAILMGWGLPGIALATAVTDFLFAITAMWLALGFFTTRKIDRVHEILRVFAPMGAAAAGWALSELARRAAGWSADPVRGPLLSIAVFCVIFVVPVLLLLWSPFGRKAFGLDELHGDR